MMKGKRTYVDVHVIQTVPPSCINRDDSGSPKTAKYGGVCRARISSQCWKRAMLEEFKMELDDMQLGIHTQKLVRFIADGIVEKQVDIDIIEAEGLAIKVVNMILNPSKKKGNKKNKFFKDDEAEDSEEKNETKVLLFISRSQAYNLIDYILEHKDLVSNIDGEKIEENSLSKEERNVQKALKERFNNEYSIDVALFGRMVASDPLLNADASAQVAHSISTHRVENEYDYFTAIDDLSSKGSAGAAMIDVIGYNSATLYRYATIAVHNLAKELGDEKQAAVEAVAAFVKAFIKSMPKGKQNTFANRTLPDAVLVTVRNDQPVNFVGAFEEPVWTANGGYVRQSVEKMEAYAEKIYNSYLDAPEESWGIGLSDKVQSVNLKELLQNIKETVAKDLDTSK